MTKVRTKESNKKFKKSDSTESNISLTDMLQPIRKHIAENTSSYVLSFDQLADFMENVNGNPDPLSVSRQYTEDTLSLIDMLGRLHPRTEHRRIKGRFTRLIKKMRKQLSPKEYESSSDLESDISQSSY